MPPAPSGTKLTVFEYNQTFSLEPSNITNAAWDSLSPEPVHGFVHHPSLAPYVSTLSVFHQLHCLNTIRRAYYYAQNTTTTTTTAILLPEPLALTRRSHVRHCFDFLRQNIMCAADTNFEPVDPVTGGTRGYGEEKVCRDFEGVKRWAGKWAARKGFGEYGMEGSGG
ncbi:hypothetical protein MMC10_007512 [Thelotrema lepadinum]|nr:hypothetical protein [Thelotrema lepadinum]